MNFPTTIIKIIQSFLKDRTFIVKIQNEKSSPQNIEYGVPQGSVLGPILFNIYMSDIPNLGVDINLAMFADDTAIFSSGIAYVEVHQKLQSAIVQLEKYFHKWKIKINSDKTQAIWFSRRRKACFLPENSQLQIGSINIDWSEHCRYL